MINLRDRNSYKTCYEKQAEMWLCKPPVGTVVVNRLKQLQILNALRGAVPTMANKDFITSDEARELAAKNAGLWENIKGNCGFVTSNEVVVCGTQGEMYRMDYASAQRKFEIYYKDKWENFDVSALEKLGVIADRNGEKVIPWVRVRQRSGQGKPKYAMFVPVQESGQLQGTNEVYNMPGIEHGKGDFIICDGHNGAPSFTNMKVVNGIVFGQTYDNSHWSDKLVVTEPNKQKPEPLYAEVDKQLDSLKNSLVQGCMKEGFSVTASGINGNVLTLTSANNTLGVVFALRVTHEKGKGFILETQVDGAAVDRKTCTVAGDVTKLLASSLAYKHCFVEGSEVYSILSFLNMDNVRQMFSGDSASGVLNAYKSRKHKNWKLVRVVLQAVMSAHSQFGLAMNGGSYFEFDSEDPVADGTVPIRIVPTVNNQSGAVINNLQYVVCLVETHKVYCFGATMSEDDFEENVQETKERAITVQDIQKLLSFAYTQNHDRGNAGGAAPITHSVSFETVSEAMNVLAATPNADVMQNDIQEAYNTGVPVNWGEVASWARAVAEFITQEGFAGVGMWADATYWNVNDKSDSNVDISVSLPHYNGRQLAGASMGVRYYGNDNTAQLYVYPSEEEDGEWIDYNGGDKVQFIRTELTKLFQ